MKKISFKKLLLSSLIALQLANNFEGHNSISNVYAETKNDDLMSQNEDGKILQMIGIRIGNYECITFGYIYRKDNNTYLKDIEGRIYNITNLDQNYIPIELIYTDAKNVLSDELKNEEKLEKEKLERIAEKFFITSETIYITIYSQFGESRRPFTYEIFEAKDFDNSNLPIVNSSSFFDSLGFPLTDDYDETKQDFDTSNNYTLGICQTTGIYSYYSNVYATNPVGESDKIGIIICYYVFDENNTRIATLRTQEQIDTFIELNAENIDKYTWKAAFYNGTNIKQILENIDSNIPVSLNNTTYFIDNSNNKTKTLSIN